MRVELLFWAGCPSHEAALRELRTVLAEEGADPGAVQVREVASEGEAGAEGFIGSPTIRIDGADIQPEPGEPAGLSCRVYRRRDGRFSPTPDPEDVREAVRRARSASPRGERVAAAPAGGGR